MPQTGERVNKRVSLHETDSDIPDHRSGSLEGSSAESSPLLPRHRQAHSAPRRKPGTPSVWETTKLSALERAAQAREFVISNVGIAVFKCSLAYLLGSLATFVPLLRNFLGHQDGKHMVATITVYFHPARSLGSMFDALICAFAAFLYAALLSITSMCISAFFTDTLDLRSIGHAIVVIFCCGGGLGFVGWVKQRKGDALVNVACSLASLAIITVVTKEGAVQAGDFSFAKISQVLKMIIMGVLATMAVSLTIFPRSGKLNLKNAISLTADSMSEMLALITDSFLSGCEGGLEENSFKEATARHSQVHSTLDKKLKEAKYEHYVAGTERQYHIEARLVQCVRRVTQSIGGLRSAAAMQFTVTKQTAPSYDNVHHKQYTPHGNPPSSVAQARTPSVLSSSGELVATLSAIDELPDEDDADDEQTLGQFSSQSWAFRSPPEIFTLFIQHLGPPMRSLAFTLKEILDEQPFEHNTKYSVNLNARFHSSLYQAVELYTEARRKALKAVYDQKDLYRDRPVEVEADWEEVAASCGHFSFSLLDVAEQVKQYLILLDELQLEVTERPAGRTWKWLKFWKPNKEKDSDVEETEVSHFGVDARGEVAEGLRSADLAASTKEQVRQFTKERLYRHVWEALALFRRDDIKFAIKVGAGAALYALPSFLPSTRPIYAAWRGEWGLLSYMLVCSMTIGASNTTGYARFLGTCLGAVCAIVAWSISRGNAFILAFLGWCMSLWTAYIIVGRGQGPMGRFIMLTYNLSALYAYSLSVKDEENDDNDEFMFDPLIGEIAGHRVVAVLSGCVWGLIITRVVWPISASEELKEGLALLWLRMGLIWRYDPLINLTHHYQDGQSSPQAPAQSHQHQPPMSLRQELDLHHYLSKLERLQASAKSEFSLEGPFPEKEYGHILQSTGRILDAIHTMSAEIMKDVMISPGEKALLDATAGERIQLCSRISHLFTGKFSPKVHEQQQQQRYDI